MRLSPARSRVKVSAPPKATRPPRAVTMPSLRTLGATKAATPESRTEMRPWLTMLAPSLPGLSKRSAPPAMKASFAISAVETTSPPTSTRDPAPNSTPLGLIRNTRPLAVSDPRIELASPPKTRFSVMEVVPGWLNRALSPAFSEKLRQSMIARSLCWVTTIWPLPSPATVADPATTCAPSGLASAGVASAPGSIADPRSSAPRRLRARAARFRGPSTIIAAVRSKMVDAVITGLPE